MTGTSSESVSIVIVAHDNWPDLELAVESALNQSWKNCEVILVDHDSRDLTQEMIRSRYADRLRYVRQPNMMDSAGYNRGIAESTSVFVQLLDGDDFIAPNKIEKQVLCFRAHPEADIVYGDVRQIQSSVGRPEWSDWDSAQHEDMLATVVEQRGPVIHSALIRRSALERIGRWDETIIGSHHDYWLRAAWLECRFVYSPGAWCFQRRGRPGQMSSQALQMLRRTEATFEKAAGYVTREPYRTSVFRRLARARTSAAWALPGLTTKERLDRIASARRESPDVLPTAAYLALLSILRTPGARSLLRTRLLSRLTRAIARATGMAR